MEKAKSYKFDGVCAGLEGLGGDAVVTAMLRWQNDQGVRMRQEYTVCRMKASGDVDVNPSDYVYWLMKPAHGHSHAGDRKTGDKLFGLAKKGMDRRLSEVSNVSLHPENLQPVNAGWCEHD